MQPLSSILLRESQQQAAIEGKAVTREIEEHS
jgi:hypothetical protein